MKKTANLILLIFTVFTASAQHKKTDTLRLALKSAVTDTSRYTAFHKLGLLYTNTFPDSAIILEQPALLLAIKNNWDRNQARSYNSIANAYDAMGDFAHGLRYYLKALRIYEHINDTVSIVMVNANVGNLYSGQDDFKKGLAYNLLAQKILKGYTRNHQWPESKRELKADILLFLGNAYLYLAQRDSAKYYYKAAEQSSINIKDYNNSGGIQIGLGDVEALSGNTKAALQHYRQALSGSKALGEGASISNAYLSMSKLYDKSELKDSSTYYAQKALAVATAGNFQQEILDAAKLLSDNYNEEHNVPLAFKYFKITTAAKDSLYSQEKVKQWLNIDFDEKERQQELQTAQAEAQNRLRTYILSGGLGVLLLLTLIFLRNSRQRQKANKVLKRQKEDIEVAMSQLKLMQNQLIQSEKMASLGELTAGIAHEIQNPLNFINNFSDVNAELIDELKQEVTQGNLNEVIAIADDIKENELKINHHGRRADGIVKGMLEHSRSRSGQKEPTDLNMMAGEFMRLSYHGLRAKEKNFNAELVTNFDPGLPEINVIPQDIGRVLLNLFNNAFYAVNQKKKTANADYKPEVSVTTSTENGQVIIKVKDNGAGIPDAIKEKIMQPFFTTKPTGEGTGLGLSLTYDMVVKGHGGKIDVHSKENEFTMFTITLPIS